MDPKTCMIINGKKYITSAVIDYKFNEKIGKWDITFKNGKTYQYNYQNIVVLTNPKSINPKSYQISYKGKFLNNITAIFSFKDNNSEHWHICFSTGYEHDYPVDQLNISKSVLTNRGAKRVFDYLKDVAEQISIRTEDDKSILTEQYKKIDFISDEAASAIYLNPEEYYTETKLNPTAPIFPFGCNESQYRAVTNALANRISIIEGPPGTGKTQTILNILANLIIQNKTVQIVSNNNSAIDNIIEKLASPKYHLDFIVAQLGKEERKADFIAKQTGTYPDFSTWYCKDFESQDFLMTIREKSLNLQEIFSDKNNLAKLRQERYNVEKEYDHLPKTADGNTSIIFKKSISSEKILEFLQEYLDIKSEVKKAGFFYKLNCRFSLGINIRKLLKESSSAVISKLQSMFYETRLCEIDNEISAIESKLAKTDADTLISEFTDLSLQYFRNFLAKRYSSDKCRHLFTKDELWQKPHEFIKEYPVVLSTTYTARSSLGKHAKFDYVIMDEASQVDVATGVLALSCATNAVIVGDTKQLSNIINKEQKGQLDNIFNRYNIPSGYNCSNHNFLSSLSCIMEQRIPQVTLCEHYRCHPQIIEFCNQKFYNGNLIIMTEQNNETALVLKHTNKGNHARGHINQRQIEVIHNEILKKLYSNYPKNRIGIIAPYRDQIIQLNEALQDPELEIDTVHKFQGREKDVIILSLVDNIVTKFSDDPNLLNVAISRAKKLLIIVTSMQEQPAGSNVGDLIEYIRYNNCEIQHSNIRSVFDYLYKQYAQSRVEYLKKYKRISEYDSENLMYALIQEVLQDFKDLNLDVICHYPLNKLFKNSDEEEQLSDKEKQFINTGLSHLDFLIYNKVSKKPVLAIEVDGFYYHKKGTKQAELDKMKDHILEFYELPLIRFPTNGSGEKERLKAKLNALFENHHM